MVDIIKTSGIINKKTSIAGRDMKLEGKGTYGADRIFEEDSKVDGKPSVVLHKLGDTMPNRPGADSLYLSGKHADLKAKDQVEVYDTIQGQTRKMGLYQVIQADQGE